MKNTYQNPNYFEIAAMRTLSKVNRTGSLVNNVTIGPNSVCLDEVNEIQGNLLKNDEKTRLKKNDFNGTNKRDDDEKENNNFISFAAKALHEMENIRHLKVTDDVNERASKLMHIQDALLSRMSENLKLSKEEMNIKNKLKSKIIENSIHSEDLVISQKMSELIKRHMDEKLKNDEKAALEVNLRKEEEIKLKNERIQILSQIQREYHDIYNQILDNTSNCKNRSKLIYQSASDFQKIQELTSTLNSILTDVNSGIVDEQNVETCQIMLQCITVIADKLKNNAEVINLEEERINREQEALDRAAVVEISELSTIVPEVIEEVSKSLNQTASEDTTELEKCISKESLEYYNSLIDQLNQFSKRVDAFIDNAPSKSFLRKLKIAIGLPVNSSSSNDPAHMRDKLLKISQFLRGNFSLPDIPMPNLPKESYFVFVVDYLCKNFISHAENRFSITTPREAYLLASLALAVWSEFPDFGPILKAIIMKKCPYTIPAYWPRYSDQTDEEYYTSLGYKFKNNELEDKDSFAKRMTGIFMFYVSMMVTPCRKNQSHPFGIENAWKWITALLNLEPRPSSALVIAEFLYIFLETCGYKMNQCFGSQFRKIVQLLVEEYIPKIEKITPSDFRAPVSRLKLFIEKNDALRRGFSEPKQLLSVDNWF